MTAEMLEPRVMLTHIFVDGLEPNDSTSVATVVSSSQTITNLSIHDRADGTDNDDFFVFSSSGSGTVSISFSHSEGDLDLEILDADGNSVDGSFSVSNNETVSLDDLGLGTFFARVYGFSNATAEYDIEFILTDTVSGDSLEANDSTSAATVIQQSVRIDDLSIHSDSDEDFFRFTSNGTGSVNVFFSHTQGNLDIEILDAGGNSVNGSFGVSDNESLSLDGMGAGTFFALVYGFNGAMADYDIEFTLPGAVSGDRLEANDSTSAATVVLQSQRIDDLSIHSDSDEDFFQFTSNGAGSVDVFFSHTQGDIDLGILDAGGNLVSGSFSVSDNESVSLDGLGSGTFFARVFGYNDAMADYDIEFTTPGTVSGDRLEANDSTGTATVVPQSQRFDDLSIHTDSDEDFFQFTSSGTGIVNVFFSHTQGDIDLEILDANGDSVDGSFSVSDNESVSLDGLGSGTFFARVYGFNDATAEYDIEIQLGSQPTSGDRLEANDSIGTATVVQQSQRIDDLSIHTDSDEDFFQFTSSGTGTVNVFFSHIQGDLDVEILDAGGNSVDGSFSVSNNESVSLDGMGSGTFFARVYGYNGAMAEYDIEFQLGSQPTSGDRLEANDSTGTATVVQQAQRIDGLSIHTDSDEDFFQFTSNGTGMVDVFFSHTQGDIDVEILDAGGNPVNGSFSVSDNESVSLDGMGSGTFFARVHGYNGAMAEYDIEFQLGSQPTGGDRLEDDDDPLQATEIRESGRVNGLSIHESGDDDYFMLTTAGTGSSEHFVAISFSHREGDIDLELSDSSGNVLRRSDSVSDDESVSLQGLAADTYFVRVSGFAGATANYDIEFRLPEEVTGLTPDRLEVNNTRANATLLRENGTTDALTIHNDQDEDYFTFALGQNATQGDFASIQFNHAAGDLDMQLFRDGSATVIGQSTSITDNERISLDGLGVGTYFLQVYGYQGAIAPYELTIHTSNGTAGQDQFEANDSFATATDLRTLQGTTVFGDLTIHRNPDDSDNEDFFTFGTAGPGTSNHSVQLNYEGDIDFQLLNSSGNVIRSSTAAAPGPIGTAIPRSISLDGLAADTYAVQVFGLNNVGTGSYALTFQTPISTNVLPDRLEPNDSRQAATNLMVVEGSESVNDLTVHAAGGTSNDDFFSFQTLATGGSAHSVSIDFAHAEGDLNLELQDESGNVLQSSSSSTDDESISLNGLDAGRYFVRVFGVGGATAAYDLQVVGPQRESGFQIVVIFGDNNMSASQRAAFTTAADRWSEIIVGDIPDVISFDGTLVDDLVIDAFAPAIDGPGGVLGSAGPTELRTGSLLPARGVMRFDIADIETLEQQNYFVEVIMHEMSHAIGLGTIWSPLGLISGSGTSDPRFTGSNATREYRTIFNEPVANSVPIENAGGPGSREGHWRDALFGPELTSSFASPGVFNPISRITAGQFEDIGYQVNYDAADPYTPPGLLTAAVSAGSGSGGLNLFAGHLHLGDGTTLEAGFGFEHEDEHEHHHDDPSGGTILEEGTEGEDVLDLDPTQQDTAVVGLNEIFAADDHEGLGAVELRQNEIIAGLTIQEGGADEREDIFTFTLVGRGTASDGITVIGSVAGELLDLELRDSDGNVLSRGLTGGQRISLAGYDPGTYFISISSDNPNQYSFEFNGQFEAGDPLIAAVDIDGDGQFNTVADYRLVSLVRSGVPAFIIENFRGPGATRSGEEIIELVMTLEDALDIDGDGTINTVGDSRLLSLARSGVPGFIIKEFRAIGALRTGNEVSQRALGLLTSQPASIVAATASIVVDPVQQPLLRQVAASTSENTSSESTSQIATTSNAIESEDDIEFGSAVQQLASVEAVSVDEIESGDNIETEDNAGNIEVGAGASGSAANAINQLFESFDDELVDALL